MTKEFHEAVDRLRQMNASIGHAREQAEAKVTELNRLLDQLYSSGYVNPLILLGPVFHSRYYIPRPGGHDSGECAQAALAAPGGMGAVLWDSEEFVGQQGDSDAMEADALLHFCPFVRCDPALQAMLLPHIEPLVRELFARFPQLGRTPG